MQPVRIPTEQDEPAWILAWRTDEIVPFIVLFGIGVITRHLTIFCIIGYIIFTVYKRLRSRFPRGYLVHWLYGHSAWVFSMTRSLKDPFSTRLISNAVPPPFDISNLKNIRLNKKQGK